MSPEGFCAALALADLLDRGGAAGFPEAVRKQLLNYLDYPSFGAWKQILETAINAIPKGRCVVPELPQFVKGKLLPLLGGKSTPAAEGIIAMRNVLAHAGRLTEGDERAFLQSHPPRFERLMLDAAFLADVHVVASPVPGALFLLHGVGPRFPEFDATRLPAGVTPGPNRLLLLSGKRVVDLFPLHAYGDLFHYVDKTVEAARAPGLTATDPASSFERVDESSPAPLLYFRRGPKDYLEYTSLAPSAAHSQDRHSAFARFRQVFQMEEWRRAEETAAARKEFDFIEWRRELQRLVVGRDEQVAQVAYWLRDHSTGVAWIAGHPGVGKSAFMAELAGAIEGEGRRLCKVLHFFRASDPRCHRMKFLENAWIELDAAFGQAPALEPDPKKRQNQFHQRLVDISQAQANQPDSERRRVVLLLDGIDEILQNDREFCELIFENCQLPGVLWICAGRDIAGLGRQFREHDAHEPFDDSGLPPLTTGNVREFLDNECGPEIYELIARDHPDTPRGESRNAFLDALAQRSEGLPLYLRLFVQDVREGKLSFREEEEKKLPRGLTTYYERLLERLMISDVSAVLTPVFCVLACAKAPLSVETLLELMKDDRLLREGREGLLRRALDFGHLMLKRTVITEKVGSKGRESIHTTDGFVLSHETFRDHLLLTDTLTNSARAARRSFHDFCIGWAQHEKQISSYRYAVRYAPEHLLEREKWDDAISLLTDLSFIEAKCAADMTFDLVEDYQRALVALPDVQGNAAEERHLREALDRYAKELAAYANCETESLEVPAALNLWSEEQIEAERQRITTRPNRADRLRAFTQFVRQDSLYFSAYASRPNFVLQQAYNSAREGPVACGADNTLRKREPDGTLLCHFGRPVYAPFPCRVSRLFGHREDVVAVALSADAKRAASADSHGFVITWCVQTGEPLGRAKGVYVGGPGELAFAPDGRKWTAYCYRHHSLETADLGAGLLQNTPLGLPTEVLLALSTDGGTVVWTEDRRTVHVVTPRMIGGHRFLDATTDEDICVLAVAPGGRQIVAGCVDGTVWLLGREGTCQAELSGHEGEIRKLAVTPNGAFAISLGVDNTLRVWDLTERKGVRVISTCDFNGKEATAFAVTPDARWAVTGSFGLVLWDLNSDEPKRLYYSSRQTGRVQDLAISANGQFVISGDDDGAVSIWDIQKGSCHISARGEESPTVDSMALSPDRTTVVTGTLSGGICVWDLDSGRFHALAPEGDPHDRSFNCIAVTPDGCQAVTGDRSGDLLVWDLLSATLRRRICAHPEDPYGVDGVSTTADGRHIVSAGEGSCRRVLKVWDFSSGAQLAEVPVNQYHFSFKMCTTGHRVATYGGCDGWELWDLHSGVNLGRFLESTEYVFDVLFTNGGRSALVASSDGRVRLWDLETGNCERYFEGHAGDIFSIALSPDQRTLATGGGDRTIRLWSLADGQCETILKGHSKEIRFIRFLNNGGWVVSGSPDRTVRVWNPRSCSCAAVLPLPNPPAALLVDYRDRLVVRSAGGTMQSFRLVP